MCDSWSDNYNSAFKESPLTLKEDDFCSLKGQPAINFIEYLVILYAGVIKTVKFPFFESYTVVEDRYDDPLDYLKDIDFSKINKYPPDTPPHLIKMQEDMFEQMQAFLPTQIKVDSNQSIFINVKVTPKKGVINLHRIRHEYLFHNSGSSYWLECKRILSFESEGKIIEDAIVISTNTFEEFDMLVKYLRGASISESRKEKQINSFLTELSKARTQNTITYIGWLYKIATDEILDGISNEEIYEDIILILDKMSSTFNNSTYLNNAVLNIIQRIDSSFLYSKLKLDQEVLFKFISKLDSEFRVTFIGILTTICYQNWESEDYLTSNYIFLGKKNESERYYLSRIKPTIDFGNIVKEGHVYFNNIGKTNSDNDFTGTFYFKSFNLLPLTPLLIINASNNNHYWFPSISVKPFLDLADKEQRIKFFTDLLLVLASSGAYKILQSSAPLFLKIIAAIELAKAPIDVALKEKSIQNALKRTEGGKWFLENWPKISTVIDISTLGVDILYNLLRNGEKVISLFKKKNQNEAALNLDEVINFAEKHLDEVIGLRKKVRVANIANLGKQGNRVVHDLLDETGTVIGQLVRTSKSKRTLTFKLQNASIKISSKDGTISVGSNITLLDNYMGKSSDFKLPVNKGEEILFGDLNIPKDITEELSGLGEIILKDSLQYFQNNKKFSEVDGIFGVWTKNADYYKDYGGESINFTKFWANVDEGNTFQEAALQTFTGHWARKNGFEKVVYDIVDIDRSNSVIVKFVK